MNSPIPPVTNTEIDANLQILKEPATVVPPAPFETGAIQVATRHFSTLRVFANASKFLDQGQFVFYHP